jgi:hypothetical protein
VFYDGSRYASAGTYTVTKPDGTIVTVTKLPLPAPRPVFGWHRRSDAERLDLLALHYLHDATAAWQLGWTNGAMSLDALGSHESVAIPREG